jgi:hypothetical protein
MMAHPPLKHLFHRLGSAPHLAAAGGGHSHSTKAIGPVPLGLGPDHICCSVAFSPLVSPTRKPQLRNGRTTPPDTAIARLEARAQFLAHEETGDAPTAPDLSSLPG